MMAKRLSDRVLQKLWLQCIKGKSSIDGPGDKSLLSALRSKNHMMIRGIISWSSSVHFDDHTDYGIGIDFPL